MNIEQALASVVEIQTAQAERIKQQDEIISRLCIRVNQQDAAIAQMLDIGEDLDSIKNNTDVILEAVRPQSKTKAKFAWAVA
jgi:hypothetical protein